MKIRSTIPLPYDADRLGIKTGIIEIDLTVSNKDDVNKIYTLRAVDYVIIPEGTDLPSYPGVTGKNNRVFINDKLYLKTYSEYDAQREYLLSIDESGLTGSELEDKLLQDALLYSAKTDTIYESTADMWEPYSDPIIVLNPPKLNTSDGKLISGESIPNSNVTLNITKDGSVTSQQLVTNLSGQFVYMPYPILTNGTKVSCTVSDLEGRVSAESNVVTIVSEEVQS